MQQSTKILISCGFALLTIRFATATIKLDIHIESLCRFSSNFIETQFGPAYEKIKHEADIDFYIYGKSKTIENLDGTTTFTCQHADWECEKNINMTCVLHFLAGDTDLETQFVVCGMNFTRSWPALDPKCSQEVGIDQSLVDQCVVNGLGVQLQKAVGLISDPFIAQSNRVPTIVINGVYNKLLSGFAQTDFIDTFRGLQNGTFKVESR